MVGLPIFLHLLQRARAKELPFSSAMFFEQSVEVSTKERRLRHLLLLALRIAVLLFLAFAFAKPYFSVTPDAKSQASRMQVVIVDRTASMQAGNRLEQAKREAAEVIRNLPGGTPVRLISLGIQAELAERPDASRDEVLGALQAMSVTPGSAPVVEGLRLASAIAESERRSVVVHVFSDFQQSASGDAQAFASSRSLELSSHPVGGNAAANFFVASVQAPSLVYSGDPVKVSAVIGQYGTRAGNVVASLWRAGQMVESKTVLVPQDARATVDFFKLAPGYGANNCEIRIDATDALGMDNKLQFVVERAEAQKILYVHEGADARSKTYFESGMAAALPGAFAVDSVRRDVANFRDLKRYAVVVLGDTAGDVDSITSYLNNGGGVLLLAGTNTARLSRLPGEVKADGTLYASRDTQRFFSPTRLDETHPVLRGLPGLGQVRFFQAAKLEAPGATVLARLGDGSPLLIDKRVGQGKLLAMASPLDNLSNDLPVSSTFVPLLNQAVNYLAGAAAQPNIQPLGGLLELRTAGDPAGTVDVTAPDGSHPLSMGEAAKSTAYRPASEGIYAIRRTTGRTSYVAFNLDRKESEMEYLTSEDLALWKKQPQSERRASDQNALVESEDRRPMWWALLVLLGIAAVAESLLGARYLAVERSAG